MSIILRQFRLKCPQLVDKNIKILNGDKMKLEDIKLTYGENAFQNASIESNDKIIDFETSNNLTYTQILSLAKGFELISEFYDVKAACSLKGTNICAVALG